MATRQLGNELPRRVRSRTRSRFLQRVLRRDTWASSRAWAATASAASRTDWYQFNVNAGDNLVITTTTPGGTSASGFQFTNDLMPTINLYDASGNLVATATGNAADGRNDVIDWTALTSGSYRVQILGAEQDQPGRVHDQHPGRHGRPVPVHGDLDQSGRRRDINFQAVDA